MAEIEIVLDDRTLRQIDEVADAMDRSRSWLVNDALMRYLDEVSAAASAPVSIARTPGRAAAWDVSIARILAWA